MIDNLGDRMKMYEGLGSAGHQLIPLLPVCIRLDGKNFHTFTKGLKRPYDQRLSLIMREVTKGLVEEANADIGYTQSDEITLILRRNTIKSQTYFGGKVFKICSVLASTCTLLFNKLLPEHLPEKQNRMPVFDCRVWNVPSATEAANVLVWREQDAVRNSIAMAAQSVYSHKELLGKSSNEMQDMLYAKGINWNAYPRFFRRGSYIQKIYSLRRFGADEIEKLPPNHAARKNPDLAFTRAQIIEVDMPIFTKVINKEGVIFGGQRPDVNQETVIEAT